MTVTFDAKAKAFRDLSASSSFPNLGYAGCIADEGNMYFGKFFVDEPDRTWETFKAAGARLVKEWNADGRWEEDKERAKVSYSWRKKHGVKVLLCLKNHGRTINDARGRILGFVRWIVDNGFTDQVAGFELGNEPYWGTDPERYARRWAVSSAEALCKFYNRLCGYDGKTPRTGRRKGEWHRAFKKRKA